MTFEGAQRARGYHEQRAKGPGEQCLKKKGNVNEETENTKRNQIEILELKRYHNWNIP